MKVFLALGSNEGDRRENIQLALEAIDNLPATRVEAVSGIIETQPYGRWKSGERKGAFLNCCCRISTGMPPERLLEALKRIEGDLGREDARAFLCHSGKESAGASPSRFGCTGKSCTANRSISERSTPDRSTPERIYSDRPIDIDILLYGRRHVHTAVLEIPHPRMRERDFVMIPLGEIM